MLKAAVIGSGASATGVLAALARAGANLDVTLFEIGKAPAGPFETATPPEHWPRGRIAEIYRHIRRETGFSLLQPKTHFGALSPRYPVGGRDRVWRSVHRGGLTNSWGATMLPFTQREFDGWPLTAEDLRPFYREIAGRVGIAGAADGLNEYFGDTFDNRPPLRPLLPLRRIEEKFHHNGHAGEFRFVAGINRAAIETRDDHPGHCIYCGECMIGCFAGAPYSAKTAIDAHVAEGTVRNVLRDPVTAIDPDRGTVRTGSGNEAGPFDRIYLCAGCVGTTGILMRSFGVREGPILMDSAVHTFPIVCLQGPDKGSDPRRYIALTNLIVLALAKEERACAAQIQIYPTMDHLWRPLVPVALWPLFSPLAARLRNHVFWGRAYLDSERSQKYALSLRADDTLQLDLLEEPDAKSRMRALTDALNVALSGTGLTIPTGRTIRQSTSSHYGCTLPYGGRLIPVAPDGRVGRTAYVCDSTSFPNLPAVSPTFTIMANAMRVAALSLESNV